ncbi:MBL fold metallo-hydrolase [Phaeobacter sp. C3_T13_0]|uniref:MBL fold metallo-hydrolase n=1 Tax=Phaeobacter cretensis TaxID=3342641 RepID=UPI0039BD5763
MDRRSFMKHSAGIAAVGGLASAVHATTTPAHEVTPAVKVTWLGASSLQIEFNGYTLLADPCFGEGENAFVMGDPNEMFDLAKGPNIKTHARNTPLRRTKLRPPNSVILSHAHEDHFDQAAARELAHDIPIILPPFDVAKIAGFGFTGLDPIDWNETRKIAAGSGNIEITALPAFHSETPQIAEILGKGNGYWITFSIGDWSRSIYWTGDTFGTQQVTDTTTAMGRPDLMIAHVGGVGTTGALGKISMDADDLLPFVATIQPKQILPVHHTTYDLFLEPIADLMAHNTDGALPLDVLASGSSLLLD